MFNQYIIKYIFIKIYLVEIFFAMTIFDANIKGHIIMFILFYNNIMRNIGFIQIYFIKKFYLEEYIIIKVFYYYTFLILLLPQYKV